MPVMLLPYQNFPKSTETVLRRFKVHQYRYEDGKHHLIVEHNGIKAAVEHQDFAVLCAHLDQAYHEGWGRASPA